MNARSPLEKKSVSEAEMVEVLQAQQKDTRLTKPTSGRYDPQLTRDLRNEELAADIEVQRKILDLIYQRGRVDLRSAEEVKAQTTAYLSACQKTGSPPTFLSVAAVLGYSQQNLYLYMQNNPNSDTTRYLQGLQSVIAGIIASQALRRNFSEAVSIFLLKNSNMGLRDNPVEMPIDPAEEPKTAMALAEEFKTIFDQAGE